MEDNPDSPFALIACLIACTGGECIATAFGGLACCVVEVEVAIGCPCSSLVLLPITALKRSFGVEVGSIMLKGHERSDQVTSVRLPTAE